MAAFCRRWELLTATLASFMVAWACVAFDLVHVDWPVRPEHLGAAKAAFQAVSPDRPATRR
jgi:hypothetical protein